MNGLGNEDKHLTEKYLTIFVFIFQNTLPNEALPSWSKQLL